jgi:formylmethanofuran dehydrogenase subunit E
LEEKVTFILAEALRPFLERSSQRHSHLCPRQVLGVRMGLAGAAVLGMPVPRSDKRLLAIVETDGCFVDGVEVSTGCTVGKRTLRVEDYGKVALTVVNIENGESIRLSPAAGVRERAGSYSRQALPGENRSYFQMLVGYQLMPAEELLTIRPVRLVRPVKEILSHPLARARCARCGEEIINERQKIQEGVTLCQSCAMGGYYQG